MLWVHRGVATSALSEDRPTSARPDTEVPALLLKLGSYPLHHGGLGVIRSLGRCGVPVHAVTESRMTPVAFSRYVDRRFALPTTGMESGADVLPGLLDIGRRIGRPSVLIPTDDEAAIAVADLGDALAEHFLVPSLDRPDVVRELASKKGMHDLCRAHGIRTAVSAFPDSLDEVLAYADSGTFPVVVKNRDAGERRRHPAVRATTIVATPEDLRELATEWHDPPNVILQEHIPAEDAEDWFAHLSIGPDDAATVFTGLKVRSFPPRAGVTTNAFAVQHDELTRLSADFARSVGFRGIGDLDWRWDEQAGVFKLVDFNPRVGAQFRLFEDSAGVDVVRAQHLALTGRAVPDGTFPEHRRFVVEDLDARARLVYRGDAEAPERVGATEWAWFAADDPLPVLPVLVGRARGAAGKVLDRARGAARAASRRAARAVGLAPCATFARPSAGRIGSH